MALNDHSRMNACSNTVLSSPNLLVQEICSTGKQTQSMWLYIVHNPDKLHSFLETKDVDGSRMSHEEAERQCFIFTVGGQDTSAAFISAFVNLVLENPAVNSKLMSEIALFEQLGKLSSPVARYDETVAMPFFMACVHETLRYIPSVSMLLPRFAPEPGMLIEGIWVPGTAELAANPFVIHRNRKIFGLDANTFRPERWLGDPNDVRQMHKYSLAFGYGSRKCLGKNVALFESQKFCVEVSLLLIFHTADG